MADNDVDVNEELLDYEDDPETETPAAEAGAENGATKQEGKVRFDCTRACINQSFFFQVKGNYVSIHSSGFRDFLLKPEVLRAIVDCGFEHPSEIQHECIPQVTSIFFPLSLGCIKSLIYDDTRRGMEIGDHVADLCPVAWGARGSPVLQGGGILLHY